MSSNNNQSERNISWIWTGGPDEAFTGSRQSRWIVFSCPLFNDLYFDLIWQVHRERHGWDLNRWSRWIVYRIYCALFNDLYFDLISQVHRERHGWDLNRWSRWRVYRTTTWCVWENRNVWRRKRSILSWLEYSIRSVRGNWHWREMRAWGRMFYGTRLCKPRDSLSNTQQQ